MTAIWQWCKADVMSDWGITNDTTGTVATMLVLGVLLGLPLYFLVHWRTIKADIIKGYRGG